MQESGKKKLSERSTRFKALTGDRWSDFQTLVGVDIDVFRKMSLTKRRAVFRTLDEDIRKRVLDDLIARDMWASYPPGAHVVVALPHAERVSGIVIHSDGDHQRTVYVPDVGISIVSVYDLAPP